MAILDKIRRRTSMLILIIGLSIFAFVISDLISKGGFGGISEDSIGSVNGEDVMKISEFSNIVDNATQGNNQRMSTMNIVKNVWSENVRRLLYNQKAEEVGIRVHQELFPIVASKSPVYRSNPYFSDSLGNFDMVKYSNLMKTLKQQNPNTYYQLLDQEKFVLEKEKENIYNTMVQLGLNYSTLDGEINYKWSTNKVDISYLQIPYKNITDSLVNISDEEVRAFMQKKPSLFEQEASVDLQYVFFEEKASLDDELEIRNKLNTLLDSTEVYNKITDKTEKVSGFKTVEDNETFVNEHSDVAYSDKYLFEDQLPVFVAKEIVNLGINEVLPPYKDGDYYKTTKKLQNIKLADSVQVSHIIVPYIGSKMAGENTTKTKKNAKKYIDSIFALVKNNTAKFKEIADSINTDNTKGKGGDIGWTIYSKINMQNFDKKISDYIFFNPKNSIDVVESSLGYHIIRIEDKRDVKNAYLLATIATAIEPSETTITNIYQQATTFEENVQNKGKTFEEASEEIEHINVLRSNNLKELDVLMMGVGNQRNIIKWAHNPNTKINEIKRFNISDGYIIAQLTIKKPKGMMNIEDAKIIANPVLKRQKKAKMLIDKYKDYSYQELTKIPEVKLNTATDISLKTMSLQGSGREPNVVGYAFTLKEGEYSNLVEGEKGVYKILLNKKKPAPEIENYSVYIRTLKMINQSNPQRDILTTLEKKSEIKDNISLFY